MGLNTIDIQYTPQDWSSEIQLTDRNNSLKDFLSTPGDALAGLGIVLINKAKESSLAGSRSTVIYVL